MLFTYPVGTLEGCGEYKITEVWRNGWKGFVHINIPFETKQWKLAARFTKPVVGYLLSGIEYSSGLDVICNEFTKHILFSV